MGHRQDVLKNAICHACVSSNALQYWMKTLPIKVNCPLIHTILELMIVSFTRQCGEYINKKEFTFEMVHLSMFQPSTCI